MVNDTSNWSFIQMKNATKYRPSYCFYLIIINCSPLHISGYQDLHSTLSATQAAIN